MRLYTSFLIFLNELFIMLQSSIGVTIWRMKTSCICWLHYSAA